MTTRTIEVFPRNEAYWDRIVRVVLGLVLISLVFIGPATPWGWLGLIPLITGLVGRCPIYSMLHISTSRG